MQNWLWSGHLPIPEWVRSEELISVGLVTRGSTQTTWVESGEMALTRRQSGSCQGKRGTMSGKGDLNSTLSFPSPSYPIHHHACYKWLTPAHTASESPGILVKMQVSGSYSRWREFYYLGGGLRICNFRSFPRQLKNVHTLTFKYHFPKLFHLSVSTVPSYLSVLVQSLLLVTWTLASLLVLPLPSLLYQPQSPPPPPLLMLYHHDLISKLLLCLTLPPLAYETSSLTLDLSHLHAQAHPSPNIPVPFPMFRLTVHYLPSPFNAIPFFCAWKTQTPALSPDQLLPPLWSPSDPSLQSPLVLPQNPLYISSTGVTHTLWNIWVSMSVVPSGPIMGLNNIC